MKRVQPDWIANLKRGDVLFVEGLAYFARVYFTRRTATLVYTSYDKPGAFGHGSETETAWHIDGGERGGYSNDRSLVPPTPERIKRADALDARRVLSGIDWHNLPGDDLVIRILTEIRDAQAAKRT